MRILGYNFRALVRFFGQNSHNTSRSNEINSQKIVLARYFSPGPKVALGKNPLWYAFIKSYHECSICTGGPILNSTVSISMDF